MRCSRCEGELDAVVPGWCSACNRAERTPSSALLDWLLDDAARVEVPGEVLRPDPLSWPDHDALRDRASDRSGVDESVTVRRGRLAATDVEVVAVVWDFAFLGGSMGSVAGERIAHAYDVARAAGLPVVLWTSTGGARMQEGMASLVQMAATTSAQRAHAEAGLLQLAVLGDPTTGGVFASHANLADVLLAEPGATIGFAGPRVAAAMTGGDLPTGSHTAEGARAAGLVDAVVPRPELRGVITRLCDWASRSVTGAPTAAAWTSEVLVDAAPDLPPPPEPADPWGEVERARATDRHRAPAFLHADDVGVAGRLRGDRAGGVDTSVDVALARWGTHRVVVIAMDPAGGSIGPAGYRTAWRGLALAERLGLPVVTLVDTPGADAAASAEAGGIAHHIAETCSRLLGLRTPVVALVVGEGGSGGALALALADRLLVQEHAIFTVIAPEGAAAILHRDRDRAAEVAALLDPTAHRLMRLGVADEVVPEPAGAEVATAVAAVARHLDALRHVDPGALAQRRAERWRRPLR